MLGRAQVSGRVEEVGWKRHGEPLFQVGKGGGGRVKDIEERTCNRCSRYPVADGMRDSDKDLVLSMLTIEFEDEEPRDEVVILCRLVALEHPHIRLDFFAGLGREEVYFVGVVVG